MLGSIRRHALHHGRFYFASLVGLAVWLSMPQSADLPIRFSLAGDAAFLVYLVLTVAFMIRLTPEHLRLRADYEDEGIGLIVAITLAAIFLNIGMIFLLLNRGTGIALPELLLTLGGIPLGWATLHVVMASHYGHLYYSSADDTAKHRQDAGGLAFPGTKEPTAWDFFYYSFVVGMTAQVSDVQVCATQMRRLTLGHGIVSFFYNTVLVALAVNVIVTLVH